MIVPFRRRSEAALRLVCFPWAGAGAAVFHPWLEFLPPTVDLCAVRLPCRESRSREAPFRCLREASSAIAESLTESPGGSPADSFDGFSVPTVFFGHSLGALLAFETALRIAKAGGDEPSLSPLSPSPSLLIVSGAVAPAPEDGEAVSRSADDLPLDDELWNLAGAPTDGGSTRFRELALRAVRADVTMARGYVPDRGAMLTMPIVAYGGRDDEGLDRRALDGWALHTRRSLEVRWFDGGHLYLREQPERVVAQVLRDAKVHCDDTSFQGSRR